jgi:hypothetical protein
MFADLGFFITGRGLARMFADLGFFITGRGFARMCGGSRS